MSFTVIRYGILLNCAPYILVYPNLNTVLLLFRLTKVLIYTIHEQPPIIRRRKKPLVCYINVWNSRSSRSYLQPRVLWVRRGGGGGGNHQIHKVTKNIKCSRSATDSIHTRNFDTHFYSDLEIGHCFAITIRRTSGEGYSIPWGYTIKLTSGSAFTET